MVDSYLKHYQYFIDKFKDRPRKTITIDLYSVQMIGLNYSNLCRILEMIANEIKKPTGIDV